MVEGIVISGDVGVNKPDRRIFDHLAERFEHRTRSGALHRRLAYEYRRGTRPVFRVIRFTDATPLRRELERLGLPPRYPGCVACGIATASSTSYGARVAYAPHAPLEPQKRAKCRAVGVQVRPSSIGWKRGRRRLRVPLE